MVQGNLWVLAGQYQDSASWRVRTGQDTAASASAGDQNAATSSCHQSYAGSCSSSCDATANATSGGTASYSTSSSATSRGRTRSCHHHAIRAPVSSCFAS
uniref:Uncharacterized protein n=1 Tax=Romanomermis culicivorax TaxID=13658 RepID=A0A915ICE6_ROMCU